MRMSITIRSGCVLLGQADAFVAGLGAEDLERLLFQQAAEGVVDVLLVVDDEDAAGDPRGRHAGAGAASLGAGNDGTVAPELMWSL